MSRSLSELERLVEERHCLDAHLVDEVVLFESRRTFGVRLTIRLRLSTIHLLKLVKGVQIESRDSRLILRLALAQLGRHGIFDVSCLLMQY